MFKGQYEHSASLSVHAQHPNPFAPLRLCVKKKIKNYDGALIIERTIKRPNPKKNLVFSTQNG